MIISILIRGLTMVCGYVYPAYECYKTVERNKPEVEQLRFWCQYWILVAILTVCERVGDAFISWIPMYGEAKLAFIIYLWYPKTKGATYVYDSFFRPYVAKHESDIDRNLSELKIRAGDITVVYWQRALSYGQTRVFDILQYIAAQSAPAPPPVQRQVPRNRQEPARPQQPTEESASQLPLSSSSQPKKEATQEAGPSCAPKETPSGARQETVASVSTYQSIPTGTEEMEVEGYEVVSMPPDANQNQNPNPPQSATEVSREETLSSIRDRLRKRRSGPNQQ